MCAHTLVPILTLYVELGSAVAIAFVSLVGVIEPHARSMYAFRARLVPALVLLWPVVLVRTAGVLWQRRAEER